MHPGAPGCSREITREDSRVKFPKSLPAFYPRFYPRDLSRYKISRVHPGAPGCTRLKFAKRERGISLPPSRWRFLQTIFFFFFFVWSITFVLGQCRMDRSFKFQVCFMELAAPFCIYFYGLLINWPTLMCENGALKIMKSVPWLRREHKVYKNKTNIHWRDFPSSGWRHKTRSIARAPCIKLCMAPCRNWVKCASWWPKARARECEIRVISSLNLFRASACELQCHQRYSCACILHIN